MQANVLNEPVFVGRKQELTELNQFLDSSTRDRGTTVFISGEAGSGKTRLTHEFLDAAKAKGVAVLSGWCLSKAAVPYFPFIEAFDSFESNNEEETKTFGIQRLSLRMRLTGPVVAGVEQREAPSPQVWRDQAFAAITKELLLLSSSRPTILFIDDIHWADSASLALLHYIARATSSERLLVLATFRSEEINTSSEGQPHPLAETLQLMGREGLFKEIKLSNLNRNDVGRIAESMLGGKLNAKFAEKLSQESRGNPLFVVESLRMIYGQGNLVQEHGQWHFKEDNMGIPDKVRDVTLRRLSALKHNQRRILDLASVIGEKFDPKLVASALSENNMNILDALNNVAQSTLLVFNEDDYYRFKHAKIQEMLYSEIPPLLKREYHLRIADSLEGRSKDAGTLSFSDIAYHYAQGGNHQKAVKYSLAAGKEALSKWSNAEAIKLFSYVLQVPNLSEFANERETALEGLGDAYYANCKFEDAIRTYDKLSMSETPMIKLRALRKEMDAIWFQERVSDRLLDLIKKSAPLAAVDRLENARVRWNIGRTHVWMGPDLLKEALTDHEEALRVFEEEYSLGDTAGVLWPVGLARIWVGSEEDRGLAEILRGIAMLHELGDIHGEMLAYQMGAVDWFCFCGLFEEGYDFLKNIRELSEKIGDYDSLAFAYLRLSDAQIMERDFSGAISNCLKALDYLKKTDTKGTLCRIYARLIQLYVLKRDIKKAKEYLDAQSQMPKEIQQMPANYIHVLWAEGFFLASTNHLEQAIEKMELGNEVLSKTFPKDIGVSFWTKSTYSLFLDVLGNTEEARQQMQEVKRIAVTGEKKYDHVNIKAGLMVFVRPKVNEAFEIRLDLVNVSRTQGSIAKIDNLLFPGLEIVDSPLNCNVNNGCVQFIEKAITPFQVKTIKLSARVPRVGIYTLSPTILYVDDLGKACSCKPRPITIAVQPVPSAERFLETEQNMLAFASESSKTVFSYLSRAFNEDYRLKMLPEEESGWRSLMQIAKEGHVTRHSMYGQMGHGGETVAELKRLKLVEARFFSGERGRGGKVFKLRVLTHPSDRTLGRSKEAI